MPELDVVVLTGSLRKTSYSRMMGRALVKLSPADMALSIVEIGGMPHYNEDVEVSPPEVYTRFRERMAASDAVLFVTPEFNRSMPGMLKNALDVGSRPWGKSIWSGKPAAVISMSQGALGGFGAHHHLRQVLVAVNLVAMPHPEAYIGGSAKLFDEAGELVDASTREFMIGFLRAFHAWIDRQLDGRA